jgi:hypothetical protein
MDYLAVQAQIVNGMVPAGRGEGLRVEQRKLSDDPQDDSLQDTNFSIEEINITGTNGQVTLQGEEARKSFVRASKTLYTLTYR